MSEAVRSPHELEQQAPLTPGFDYEKFDAPDVWAGRVIVPVVRTPEKTTYLVAINGQNEERWKERVQVLGINGIPCHLLPSRTDQYSEQESQFAREALNQPAGEIRTPYAPRLRKEEALVFDTSSVKSVIDVMIAAGQDSQEIRQVRLAALHGEPNPIVNTIKNVLELGALSDSGDARADALRTAYGFQGYASSSLDVIEDLAECGLDAFRLRRVQERIAEGIDPEVVKASMTDSEAMQQTAAAGWTELIEFARVHNEDIHNEGIYTELHKVGGVLVALPSIVSTGYNGTFYVEFGGGHTLAEIYGNTELNNRDLSPELNDVIDNAPLMRLTRQLGIIASGPGTLQRRCRTTFDESGRPVIHVRAHDPYEGRLGKMTNEQIRDALSSQRVANDLVNEKNVVLKAAEEFDDQVRVSIRTPEQFEEPRHPQDTPLACVTAIDTKPEGTALTWTCGYTRSHDDLFAEACASDDEEHGVLLHLGTDTIRMRTIYIGANDFTGKTQDVLWKFYGRPDVLDKHAGSVKGMIDAGNKAIINYMGTEWNALPDSFESATWLVNSDTKEEGPVTIA